MQRPAAPRGLRAGVTGARAWIAVLVSVAVSVACAGSGDARVDVRDFAFNPPKLSVRVGSTIRYVNGDRADHTVTQGHDGVADPGASFDLELSKQGYVNVTFAAAGEVRVTCRLHPTMNQIVMVTP